MNMEPNGGCFYRPHMVMVNSGQFWRCKHGHTFVKRDCIRCAIRHPIAALRWHFSNPFARDSQP